MISNPHISESNHRRKNKTNGHASLLFKSKKEYDYVRLVVHYYHDLQINLPPLPLFIIKYFVKQKRWMKEKKLVTIFLSETIHATCIYLSKCVSITVSISSTPPPLSKSVRLHGLKAIAVSSEPIERIL